MSFLCLLAPLKVRAKKVLFIFLSRNSLSSISASAYSCMVVGKYFGRARQLCTKFSLSCICSAYLLLLLQSGLLSQATIRADFCLLRSYLVVCLAVWLAGWLVPAMEHQADMLTLRQQQQQLLLLRLVKLQLLFSNIRRIVSSLLWGPLALVAELLASYFSQQKREQW